MERRAQSLAPSDGDGVSMVQLTGERDKALQLSPCQRSDADIKASNDSDLDPDCGDKRKEPTPLDSQLGGDRRPEELPVVSALCVSIFYL